MTLAEAHDAVRAQLSPVLEQQAVTLARAHGRVLAADLIANVDLPPYDNSAVDGYAVRSVDLVPDRAVTLRLAGEAAAGHPFEGVIQAGETVRILTGAPLPQGADLVVMQEVCFTQGDTVGVRAHAQTKRHWRRRGEDVSTGSRILLSGHRLRSQDLALAGALGCKELIVRRQLRWRCSPPVTSCASRGVRSGAARSGMPTAACCAASWNMRAAEIRDLGILRDDPHAVEGALSAAARDCDLLVTSGGMSVGHEDHIRSIIGRRGTLDIWPLAIKPGRPVGLGDIDDCPILALPGNPIAAVVTFIAFGRMVIDVLAGALDDPPAMLALPAGFASAKARGVRQFLLASVERQKSGATAVVPCNRQGSAMLSALAVSGGLIVLGEDCERVEPGEFVDYLPLEPYLH